LFHPGLCNVVNVQAAECEVPSCLWGECRKGKAVHLASLGLAWIEHFALLLCKWWTIADAADSD